MGKSYKDKYKRNSSFDKRNKRIKQGISKFKFCLAHTGKTSQRTDEQV